ncbi:MAG TPA: Bax inhibitor-1/YccA family protein [Lactobacillaceae bacterium]|jgi:hypothetical protein
MDNFNFGTRRDVTGFDAGLQSFFKQTYSYMGIALLVTALTGFIVERFFLAQIYTLIYGNMFGSLALIGVQFLVLFMIGRNAVKNPASAFGLLMLFSVMEGLTTGILLAIYTSSSILVAFLSAAAVFAAMAFYGMFTKKSLAGLGAPLFGLVIGLIVASLINLFFPNGIMQFFISAAGVVIFSLYTAYDNNMLKQMYFQFAGNGQATQGLAISGALSLYLDFINLFFSLLQLLGNFQSRD